MNTERECKLALILVLKMKAFSQSLRIKMPLNPQNQRACSERERLFIHNFTGLQTSKFRENWAVFKTFTAWALNIENNWSDEFFPIYLKATNCKWWKAERYMLEMLAMLNISKIIMCQSNNFRLRQKVKQKQYINSLSRICSWSKSAFYFIILRSEMNKT